MSRCSGIRRFGGGGQRTLFCIIGGRKTTFETLAHFPIPCNGEGSGVSSIGSMLSRADMLAASSVSSIPRGRSKPLDENRTERTSRFEPAERLDLPARPQRSSDSQRPSIRWTLTDVEPPHHTRSSNEPTSVETCPGESPRHPGWHDRSMHLLASYHALGCREGGSRLFFDVIL